MKKLFSICIYLVLLGCNDESVVEEQLLSLCDNGSFNGQVILNTQQEVEDFGALCHTKIDGSLFLQYVGPNDEITDLSPLVNLESVKGRIFMSGITVNNLNGLQGLKDVGGFTISHCNNLVNLTGLDNLISIGDLDNSSQPTTIEELVIHDNSSLETLEGLENLKAVEGIRIFSNMNLQSLTGLENLEVIVSPWGGNLGLKIGTLPCTDLCPFNGSLDDFCALQNFFRNGNYDPDIIFMQHELGTGFPVLDVTEISIQQIIDGDCTF